MPLGQRILYYVGGALFSQAEMQLGRGNGLLLHQQAGAQLHLPSDAEGIDALVAGGYACPRPENLPLILFASLVEWPAALPRPGRGPAGRAFRRH